LALSKEVVCGDEVVTIEVIVRHKGSNTELAHIEIENVSEGSNDLGDYSVRFGVHKGEGLGLHQRGIMGFPRRKYNVLALLLQALNTLEPAELEFVGEWDTRPPLQDLPPIKKKRSFW
jgi:hypothetical protein